MFGVKSITMINKILMLKLNDIGSGKYITKYVKHNIFGALPVFLQRYWKKIFEKGFQCKFNNCYKQLSSGENIPGLIYYKTFKPVYSVIRELVFTVFKPVLYTFFGPVMEVKLTQKSQNTDQVLIIV